MVAQQTGSNVLCMHVCVMRRQFHTPMLCMLLLLLMLRHSTCKHTASAGVIPNATAVAPSASADSYGVGFMQSLGSLPPMAASTEQPPAAAGDVPGLVKLSLWAVLFSAVPLGFAVAISLALALKMHSQIIISMIRCFIQLSFIGFILILIFRVNTWWLTFLYSVFMVCVATLEAMSRPSHTYHGLLAHLAAAITGAAYMMLLYGLVVVVHPQPWWQPQYLIPLLGMILGNVMTGVSLGVRAVVEELVAGRDQLQFALARGAAWHEAMYPALARSMQTALTPLLNQMSVVGLVSLPGAMTGQILAGADPYQAARYQIIIMFLLGGGCTLATLSAVLLTAWNAFDGEQRLKSDWLKERKRGSGVLMWLAAQAQKVWNQLLDLMQRFVTSFYIGRHDWRQRLLRTTAKSTLGRWLFGASTMDSFHHDADMNSVVVSDTDMMSDTDVDAAPLLSPGSTASGFAVKRTNSSLHS